MPGPWFSAIQARPETIVAIPIGTLMKKIQCQLEQLRDRAAGDQADRGAGGDRQRVDAHRLRPLTRVRELGGDDRDDRRDRAGAAEPCTKRAMISVVCESASPHAADASREQGDPGEEDPAAADQVAEPAAEQEEAAERDEVAVEHPRQARLAEVQVGLDPRQRDRDDRAVHDRHQLGHADDGERDPAPALG